ncbi:uncharacterized protein CcaverHIS019_0702760 [Cutaneotrichosporon cavernicola]|uniref:non-specific serine/threonine protein kinase n=1 Tax=Cutaneotrichosporon cavernicola TaxID=279322 RepID=A0AA48QYW3_9TREE|nr:uncharacterized protein CcaverHIS019_0702760 [Cutaneotrichosporon cavernicola]BEI94695.1 hypothetical protein CcaverHIS019_0702760 [Cutaneotrichosporon cavernicola]
MASSRRPSASPTSGSFAEPSEMDKYRLVSNIGKGSFGVISKIQRIEDGKEFALKELDYGKMNERDRKQIMAEVAILESLKHRNIVQLVQKIRDAKNERIYIVMEYCTSGDLGSLIRKAQRSTAPLHEDRIWNIFLQITLALHHCHWPEQRRAAVRPSGDAGRTQVLHRDLKPENVFLSGDFVKLGDFGLSKDMAGHTFTQTYVGTPLYMPPEILAENRYDTKSDIWSLGCLVYEMCALHSPFHTARTQEELISMVKSGKMPPLPSNISPALKLVIKAMLNLNPIRRPSTRDLLEMEEMKLHRKLFTVQNQTSVLTARKQELEQWEATAKRREERFKQKVAEMEAREAALVEREQALNQREAEFNMHWQQLEQREEILRENRRRLTVSHESLQAQWAALREERPVVPTTTSISEEESDETDFGPVLPQRASLEEPKSMPISSITARHAAYHDTPSKIPGAVAYNSPVPLDSKIASKISRLNGRRASGGSSLPRLASKSLTNLAARSRADEELSTPTKNVYRHLTGRTSIGSPGELDRVFIDDITMHTATSFGSPANMSPYITRARSDDEVDGPPTLIPQPNYVYRPDSTPAKWDPEALDAPSPFLRRTTSAAPLAQPNFTASAVSSRPSAQPREARPPLSAIQPQVAPSAAAPRKLPRSRSGTLSLHHAAVVRNAARTEGLIAAPVRRVAGRDPARC